MNSLNNMNLVKHVSFVGILAAAFALPVSAQGSEVKPGTAMPEAATPEAVTPAAKPAAEAQTPAAPEAQAPTAPTAPTAPSTTAPSTTANSGTIVDVASASESFQTLVAALTEAELAEVLQGEGPFTVFAPTDEAFAALPAGTVEELLKPENRDRLVTILQYHVVAGAFPSTELASGQVPTVEGDSVTVTVSDGAVKVNDANVIQPDIEATNGVIHAIDRVILPPQ